MIFGILFVHIRRRGFGIVDGFVAWGTWVAGSFYCIPVVEYNKKVSL